MTPQQSPPFPGSPDTALPHVGLTFKNQTTFTAESIAAFATLVGDTNPLHHDATIAEGSRVGGLIASGTHTGAVMMGAAAAHFSRYWPNIGLGYTVRMRRPVRAGDTLTFTWRVVSVERSAKLRGSVSSLDCSATNAEGVVVLTGSCQALIPDDDNSSSGSP